MSGEARLEILTRIHRAGARRDGVLPRRGVETSTRLREAVVEQFAEFAAEYRARVTRATVIDLPGVIDALLRERGSERVVVPADFPPELIPRFASVFRDEALGTSTLNTMHAVVTTSAVGVAETGTVVLDHGAGQGRRALSLVPDHHVCVVFEHQVVDSVPEAVARLGDAVREGRPLTWISGPSATSDIELSRVEGVHGPRVLDLVLVG